MRPKRDQTKLKTPQPDNYLYRDAIPARLLPSPRSSRSTARVDVPCAWHFTYKSAR